MIIFSNGYKVHRCLFRTFKDICFIVSDFEGCYRRLGHFKLVIAKDIYRNMNDKHHSTYLTVLCVELP